MNLIKKIALIMALSMIVPLLATCQYFQGLYDIDSSQDTGWDIFLQPDGSYIVYGTSAVPSIERWILFNMEISSDGTVVNKNLLNLNNFNLYMGNPGATARLPSGGYISPITGQNYFLTDSWAGLIKYDATGDTVFLKTYTDTPLYYDGTNTCTLMPDGGYAVGGMHGLTSSPYPPAYIVRTDSFGNFLWEQSYQANATQFARINNFIPLADGRMVAGAISTVVKNPGPNSYYYNTPWYMLLDSLGNIIRDTLYTTGFQNGGLIFPDMNGGYICFGNMDSLLNPDPTDYSNFPSYIAHLDSNFRMTWLTIFPFSVDSGNRQACLVKQLRDSSYIILGDMWPNETAYEGWAAKISRTGEMVWSRSYQSDTINDAHLRGVCEKPDGSLVFVGESYNDTLPSWHQGEDVWLLGTDSNGCENGFCAPAAVKPLTLPKQEFSLFPNPTYGTLTTQSSGSGIFYVYTIEGQRVGQYPINTGNTDMVLPVTLAPGLYMGVFKPDAGGTETTVRLVYQP
jgi:hypothetical protein